MSSHILEFIESLPRLTESDLIQLGQADGTCPICFTAFSAVLAAEELAQAMESPAAVVEDMGVTRLSKTCGHFFCRKDLSTWIRDLHTTCPACRTSFMSSQGLDQHLPISIDDSLMESEILRLAGRVAANADGSTTALTNQQLLQALSNALEAAPRADRNTIIQPEEHREQFHSMYS